MAQRITASLTSVSWIPSEAMTGPMRLPMDVGIGHYDDPPPAQIEDLDRFVEDGRCRFANHLTVWVDIEGDRIVDSGMEGRGLVAATKVRLGPASFAIPAIGFAPLRSTQSADDAVTFTQSAGGRTGAPLLRRTKNSRLPRMKSPTAWTTLSITVDRAGTARAELLGASPFPRHWLYDESLQLVQKAATIDFTEWTRGLHDIDTPWGDTDHDVRTADVESDLERQLSTQIMRGGRPPRLQRFEPGDVIMTQGDVAGSMGVMLDGLVDILVDGTVVAQCGPGCVIGERAFLEHGSRTATVRAVTTVRFAEATPDMFRGTELQQLRDLHQREVAAEND